MGTQQHQQFEEEQYFAPSDRAMGDMLREIREEHQEQARAKAQGMAALKKLLENRLPAEPSR